MPYKNVTSSRNLLCDGETKKLRKLKVQTRLNLFMTWRDQKKLRKLKVETTLNLFMTGKNLLKLVNTPLSESYETQSHCSV